MAKPPPRPDLVYTDIVRSLHDFDPTEPGCLKLKAGDFVYVHSKDPSGWWNGTCGNTTGWFPSNFIEPAGTVSIELMQGVNSKLDEDITKLSEQNENSPSKDRDISSSPVKLPPYWRKKETPTGQEYYYNTETNETTYELEKVLSTVKRMLIQKTVEKRKSLMWKAEGVVANAEKKLPRAPAESSTWIPGPRSLLRDSMEISWELLISNILKSISDLNYSAKNDIKGLYIQQCGQIIRSIRDMLACSGTISADSAIIRSNKSLATYHESIMSSLSKLILAAKVGAGLWPPPDAVHTLRYQAGQVLLAVRHFVAVAQDAGLTLSPAPAEEAEEFDMVGNQLSDQELISRLEQNSDQIMNSIAALITKITRERSVSPSLIEQVKKTITEIGQFLSLIEDIHFDATQDSDDLISDFKSKKEELYVCVNVLVTSSSSADSGISVSNPLGAMLENATAVLNGVEDVLSACKILFDHKELILQKTLFNEVENAESADLARLQRRARNLGLSSNRTSSRGAQLSPNPLSSSTNRMSSANWSRDGKTISVESRRSSRASEYGNSKSHSTGRLQQESPLDSANQAKLSQFFGEDIKASDSMRISDPALRPWFLKKEQNFELSYNMEGTVNGGTFPALVERLTVHDQPVDQTFVNSFLLTFHLFGSAEQLFSLLVARFSLEPPAGLRDDELSLWTEKKLIPVQVRVCNVLKLWLENFWVEKSDDLCLDDIHDFASKTMMDTQPQAAAKILELVSRKVASDVFGTQSTTPKMKRVARPDEFQQPILPKSLKRFSLLDIDPLETARQLTMMEMALFMKIQPVELMKQEWSKRNTNSKAVNVLAMTANSTKITGWVICTILQAVELKKRATTLKYFIKVAERCLLLNNFNTLIAIQSAFNSSTISRLKKTWELLSAKTRGTFETLRKATDHSRNYADYRAALKNAQLPCLPFLGLFLTDLTFTDDGNPDMRNNGKLINFDKYARTAKIITDLQSYQLGYSFTPVQEIQDYLAQSIEDRGLRDSQELYELSLQLEPRDGRVSAGPEGPEDVNRELEEKIQMLQKAGML